MMYFLIKSNHGNHIGFNRKWKLLCSDIDRNFIADRMLDIGFLLSDSIVSCNNRPYDNITGRYIITNAIMRRGFFEYDGYMYMIVDGNSFDIFDGGTMGYLPCFLYI